MFRGGIADKLGNEYEWKWAVRALLKVLSGSVNSMRYEGIPKEFRGFEFALYRAGCSEWHQTKINAPSGNWTPTSLHNQGVLSAFKQRLSTDTDAKCVFISQDPARQMRELCEKACMASDVREFMDAVSKKNWDTFDELAGSIWTVKQETAFEWLRRCEFRTESEQSIEEAIATHGRYLLCGGTDLFATLSDYLINNLNTPITTERARDWIRENDIFTFRSAFDPTLREKVDAANRRYLESYMPFGLAGRRIKRAETDRIIDKLQDADDPSLVLLTGEAGSGKSGVVREIMTRLTDRAVLHLTFRMDRFLSCRTGEEIGHKLLDRDESPVSVLAGLAPDSPSVLIVDQIDAVSEISGRTGAVKDVLFELIRETRHYGDVRCLLVCRDFDLENDPQYRDLEQRDKAERVRLPLLSWENDVAPLLKNVGIPVDGIPDSQRELLLLPLNLSIFLEIDDPAFNFSSGTALMERLLEKKTRDLQRDRNVGWNTQDPLSAMSDWMSDKQDLSCPDYVLGEFDGARDWLSSEGLIVVEGNRLAFFHESFFDFTFARSFARSNLDIADLLTSTEQHLFRRTQVRQILTLMRGADRPRYLETLETVLTRPDIRLHVKRAVAQWLATLGDATQDELDIILRLDDGGEDFPVLLRKALFVSENWFDLLNGNGGLSAMLMTASERRQDTLLWWLGHTADKRPAPVSALLKRWWGNDPARAERLVEWFGFVRRGPSSQALAALLIEVIGSGPSNLFYQDHGGDRMLLNNWCEDKPGASAEILQALFDQWFQQHPGEHLFTFDRGGRIDTHNLTTVVEKAPDAFLDGMIPALLKSIQIVMEKPDSSCFSIRYKTSNKDGPGALFSLYHEALHALAKSTPHKAEQYLDLLDPTLHEALLHLHLETISANPAALGHRFAALLDEPHLFSAGWQGVEWSSFAEATRSVVEARCLPVETVEERVFRHRPEYERAKWILRKNRENGEVEPFETKKPVMCSLNNSGYEERCILKTIGSDLLSARGKKRLAELERKFPSENVPTPPAGEAHWIGSPIPSDVTRRMTDAQWLSAVEKHSTEHGKRLSDDGRLAGGAPELARELEAAAKSDPDRFARLFLRLPTDAHPAYRERLLWGLAETEKVDEDTVIAALRVTHAYPGKPFGLGIIRVIERHPALARDDGIFKALLWYAEHGDTHEMTRDTQEENQEDSTSIDNLVIIAGINSPRGAAWEALGRVVQHDSNRVEDIWAFVARRAGEETSSPVRAMMFYVLTPLFNLDRTRFGACLRRLAEPIAGQRDDVAALIPLATHLAVRLFPYIERDLPDLALELMGRMISASDRRLNLIGAWWTLAERLRRGNTKDRFPDIHRQSPAHTQLWASLLCEFAADTEFRDMAVKELKELFSHETPEVRKAAADVFRYIPKDEFPHFMDLARAFVESPAFKDNALWIIEALKEVSCDVTDLVLEVGARLNADVRQLQEVLKREYVNSENRPEVRARFLVLFDALAEQDLYGADDLMGLDDR